MMSKSLNYAYPQKYAEGGPVAEKPSDDQSYTPPDLAAMIADDPILAAMIAAGAETTYNRPPPPEPETPTASGSGSGLVDPETPTGYQSSEAAPPEQKSLNYAFVDADGNSYNMGDVRPGHDGTSLERAIANVQEYYDFAPGSFTVSVPSEERLVGTYDSDSGSFQAATSDMRDLNGFSVLPGEGLMPDLPRPPNPFLDLEVMPDFIDPMIPEGPDYTPPTVIPPVVVPPNTGTTFPVAPDAGSFLDFYNDQPPVNAPVFSPGPVAPPVYQPQTQGRTYGALSGTPMGPTNSIQPFTPYMPPQQGQGADIQSLISDTDYFLNNSAPRTSVFKRS